MSGLLAAGRELVGKDDKADDPKPFLLVPHLVVKSGSPVTFL